MRRAVGRSRDFRQDRKNLIDATFPLLISVADRSTNIVTMNVSRLAKELSPKDENGNVILETAMTVRRVCTLIQELIRFGLFELPEGVQWDSFNRYWFPKHVVLSEQFWKLVGVNIDKLYAQQQERLRAEADGILAPGEEINISAARERWYDRMRDATLVRRRVNALKQKHAKKLGTLQFDDRLYAMADHLTKPLPADELYRMTPIVNRPNQVTSSRSRTNALPPHHCEQVPQFPPKDNNLLDLPDVPESLPVHRKSLFYQFFCQ